MHAPPIRIADLRTLVIRTVALFLLVAGMALPAVLIEDPGLRATLPLFAVMLFLQLLPAFWPREVDLCAPTVLSNITAAFVTVSTAIYFLKYDEVHLDLVELTTPSRATAVATKALWAMIFAQLAYYLGYYARFGRSLRGIFPKVAGLVWDRRRMRVMAFVTVVIFLVTYTYFQVRTGAALLDFTQYGAGKRVWRGDQTLSWMTRGILIGMVPAFLYFTQALASRRLRVVIPVIALSIVVALFISRLGQRGFVAFAILALLYIFHYLWRRVPAILFVAVYFIGVAVSNITWQWRIAPEDQPREFALAQTVSHPSDVLAGHEAERQRFSAVCLIMDVFPDAHPYLLGESWASIAVAPVPRWLWPEKAEHFRWQDNRIVFNLVGTPVPTPFVAVLYANFAWIGILAGMFLLGAFHRGLYTWLLADKRDPNVVILYALFMTQFAPSLMGIAAALQYILPVWLIIRFIGRRPAAAPATAGALSPAAT